MRQTALTSEDEPVGDDLPLGWVEVPLGELVFRSRPKITPQPNSALPFIGMEHIESNSTSLSGRGSFGAMKSSAVHFQPGDVLYGRLRPYLNKVYRADFEGVCSAEFIVFAKSENLDPDYLKWILHSRDFVSFASHQTTGDRPRIDFSQIANYTLPLPSFFEQERIVAKIDELFSELDAGVTSLERARVLLKKYRQAVLKAAVTGELTRDWRERHRGHIEESGADLLQRILKARRKAWETAELNKLRAKGKPPSDDRWKQKYKEPQPPDTSGLPELPEGWVWATVGSVAALVTDGDHNPPKRVQRGVPHLTARNVKQWKLDPSGCTFVSEAGFEQTRARYEPKEGDIIVTCVGTIGETAIVPSKFVFSADRNLAAIRVVQEIIMTRYLHCVLNAPAIQELLRQASGSTAQPHLYLRDVNNLVVQRR